MSVEIPFFYTLSRLPPDDHGRPGPAPTETPTETQLLNALNTVNALSVINALNAQT